MVEEEGEQLTSPPKAPAIMPKGNGIAGASSPWPIGQQVQNYYIRDAEILGATVNSNVEKFVTILGEPHSKASY